jgi:hypothetical protein
MATVAKGFSSQETGLINFVFTDVCRFGNGLGDVGEGKVETGVLVELGEEDHFAVDEIEGRVHLHLLAGERVCFLLKALLPLHIYYINSEKGIIYSRKSHCSINQIAYGKRSGWSSQA